MRERGCCTAIQDYLINAGENARGSLRQPGCLVLCLQTSQTAAVCEMISHFSVEWIMLEYGKQEMWMMNPNNSGHETVVCMDAV